MFAFISHSHFDAPHAHQLSNRLSEINFPHFLYQADIGIGKHITQAVQNAIARTTHFLILVSPASKASGWVNFEFGFSQGVLCARPGTLEVLPWLIEQAGPLPEFLAGYRYARSLDEILIELDKVRPTRIDSFLDSLVRSGHGYSRHDYFAKALRLIGASDESFLPKHVKVRHASKQYILPENLLRTKAEVLQVLEDRAKEKGALFFNGPNTRLERYDLVVSDGDTEQKELVLHLGEIGWHDISVARWHTDGMLEADKLEKLDSYVQFERVAATGSPDHSNLPGVLDTATTLITSDGYLLFSRRGARVSLGQGLYTSSVAENIHHKKDSPSDPAANRELPAPFRAVMRGIDEEISPAVAEAAKKAGVLPLCLGLSFDLVSFHPDMLFIVFLPMTRSQVLSAYAERLGSDYIEGKLMACSIIGGDDELLSHFATGQWGGAGMASIIRALEFIDVRASRLNLSREQFIQKSIERRFQR